VKYSEQNEAFNNPNKTLLFIQYFYYKNPAITDSGFCSAQSRHLR